MSGPDIALALTGLLSTATLPYLNSYLQNRSQPYTFSTERAPIFQRFLEATQMLDDTVICILDGRKNIEKDFEIKRIMRELDRAAKDMVKIRKRLLELGAVRRVMVREWEESPERDGGRELDALVEMAIEEEMGRGRGAGRVDVPVAAGLIEVPGSRSDEASRNPARWREREDETEMWMTMYGPPREAKKWVY